MITNPLNAYKETKIKTASPGQLILMLYAEAIKQASYALELLEQDCRKHPQNIEKINNAIIKTQDIITELMASLDFEAGGEIAHNLFSLYVYFNHELMEANIQKNASLLRPVKNMLEELYKAWVVAVEQTQGTAGESKVGVNIAG
ncbi:MAG TPA: flagellar export chaperone FliS [Spirochaetales bacterium]|nr:flagellar export chaperone FliS [Spirochaetales bacterium]HOT58670.1 flagellar export chaperone FliS [Spirochaetales bacterium]HPD80542.1 flagellar export chaperone FliS [Spirochaetales bacterium]HQK34285.1 flagellar export chaperone FliS [Spirochaetales bacterium]HRV27623.1 flagellar export chaperone FliS [Spirochaetia bacterium]